MAADNAFDRLMERLRRGDEEAAAEVFHRFARRLIALARSQLDSWIRTRVEPEDVVQFETAWRDGKRPRLSDFLPPEGIERRAVLVELVYTDLECRLKAGESARAEEYPQQYPELREEQAALSELIEAELRLGSALAERVRYTDESPAGQVRATGGAGFRGVRHSLPGARHLAGSNRVATPQKKF